MTKRCRECRRTKPISEFPKHRNRPDGHGAECKPCKREYMRQRPPGYVRSSQMKSQYGITLAEYEEMLEAQGGGCAICGAKPVKGKRRHAIDHCHTTGKVRGILCNRCNVILGHLEKVGAAKFLSYMEASLERA